MSDGVDEYKSVDELVGLLRDRGLGWAEPGTVQHALETIGHHRLREYYSPFRDAEKKFREDVDIDDIVRLYSFDRRLKLLILGPLEKLEVALRALIIKGMGDFTKAQNSDLRPVIQLLDKRFYVLEDPKAEYHFTTLSEMCRRDAERKWARIARERRENKGLSPEERRLSFSAVYEAMPAWELIHMISFGPLVTCFRLLKDEIAGQVTDQFELKLPVFRSVLIVLKNIRNACAHHEPIWNWNAQWSQMQFPRAYAPLAAVDERNIKTIYASCAALHILLAFLSRGKSTWYRRLKKLANEFDHVDTSVMGFPSDWQTKIFWSTSDIRTIRRVELIKSHMSGYQVPLT